MQHQSFVVVSQTGGALHRRLSCACTGVTPAVLCLVGSSSVYSDDEYDRLKMAGLPATEGHSVHEEVVPSLSKTCRFLISANKTAAAKSIG